MYLPAVWLAEENPIKEAEGIVKFIFDNPFAIALTFVFLAAVIGAFVAARKRDRCLKRFRRFPVTIREQGGRLIWGRLRVFSKGLELVFDQPYDHPAKSSFLVYEGELGRLLTVHRFLDRLEGHDAKRRAHQAARLAAPPLYYRIGRWLRNIVNTFRDAFVQAFGMTMQQATKRSASPVLTAQGGQINAIGTTLIGEAANAYEPMLEQYIGDPVILELINPADAEKRVVEYHGYLGEYSPQFLLLAGVRRRFVERVRLDGTTARLLEDQVAARSIEGGIRVENRSRVPVTIEGVEVGDTCHNVNTRVDADQTVDVPLPREAAGEGAAALIGVEREFDLIVPRAAGLVRHASEPPGESPSPA